MNRIVAFAALSWLGATAVPCLAADDATAEIEDEVVTEAGAPGAPESAEGRVSEGEATEAEGSDPKTVCELIETAAAEHAIPVDFFTRLIFKESSFRAGAVSPKGAQGIAQFMPATAKRRGLANAFDPAAALMASAHYLKDLSKTYGSLGLAAAAYNAGESRVDNWLAGSGRLPWETRDYVFAITGKTAEEWSGGEPEITADGGAQDQGPRRSPTEAAGKTDTDLASSSRVGSDVDPDASSKTTAVGGAPKTEAAKGCVEIAALLAKPGAGLARLTMGEGRWAPWGVQVAGHFSLDRAMALYARVQRRHGALLGGVTPMVVRARFRGRAPLFQVRVPAATRAEADRLCRELKSGGGACVVFRN